MYEDYHKQTPLRISQWLQNRGINLELQQKHFIGWNGRAITIPIFDDTGKFLFFKYRRDPEKEDGPKYWYEAGTKAQLYNSATLANAHEIIVCEGEFDCLVLEAHGIRAVTSTGGAGTFEDEWVEKIGSIPVYICMDNDAAGKRAAVNLLFMFNNAKLISLPDGYKDITDFFLGPNPTTFVYCLLNASSWPELKYTEDVKELSDLMDKFRTRKLPHGTEWVRGLAVPLMQELRMELAFKNAPPKKHQLASEDLTEIKKIPITDYYKGQTRKMGKVLAGICPFHSEKTASFRIYPATNTWHCFGCDAGNDIIDFVMKQNNCDFNEAIKILKQ